MAEHQSEKPECPYFSLVRPCDSCPLRSDIEPFLTSDRVQGIIDSIKRASFNCHKTIDYSNEDEEGEEHQIGPTEKHCAGSLIAMEKWKCRGDMQQIAERLGLYDPEKLDMSAPVFETPKDMIDAQQR